MMIYVKKGISIIISCVILVMWQSSCSESGYESASKVENSRPEIPMTAQDKAYLLLDNAIQLDFQAYYDSALTVVDSAALVFSEIDGAHGLARSGIVRARILEHLSRFEDGLAASEKALGLIDEIEGRSLLFAEALDVKADNLIRLGRYEEALAVVEEGLAIREALGSEGGLLAQSYLRKGWVHQEWEQFDSATDSYRLARDLFVASDEDSTRNLARILNNLGTVAIHTGQYEVALEYLYESFQIRQSIMDSTHPLIGYSLGNIAHTHIRLGNYRQALDGYLKALDLFKLRLGVNHHDVAIANENIADIYSLLGDNNRAILYAQNAVSIDSTLFGSDHRRFLSSKMTLGSALYKSGRLSEAEALLSITSKKWHSKFGRYHAAIEDLCRIEILQRSSKSVSCAKDLETLYINDRFRSQSDVAEVKLLQAEAYATQSDLETAIRKARDAKELFSTIYSDSSSYHRKSTLFLATLLSRTGSYMESIKHYNSLIANSHSHSQDYDQSSSLLLGKAHIGRAVAAAKAHTAGYIDLDEDQLIDDFNQAIDYTQKSMSMSRSSLDPSFDLANDIFDTLFNQDPNRLHDYSSSETINTLFNASEVGRVVSLRLHLQKSKAKSFARIPDSLRELESSLATRIEANSTALMRSSSGSPAKRVLTRQRLINATQSYDSLITVFESEYPRYYELKYKSKTATIEAVQEYLSRDQAFLEYVVGQDSTYVFTITSENASLTTVGATAEIKDVTSTYRKGITTVNDSLYFVGARDSHALLFQPIEHIVEDRDLIIVPDDFLFTVPFEPLLDPRENTSSLDFRYADLNYFFRNRNISYTYSATIFLETRRKPEVQPSKTFLAFAPLVEGNFVAGTRSSTVPGDTLLPAIQRPLNSLPASAQEVNRIRKTVSRNPLTRPYKSKVYLNEEALEANLKLPGVADYRYVHLATHGFIEEDNPGQSSLVFRAGKGTGEDGILYLGEIYNLNLNADVVVLSACDTGLGQLTNNEGVVGLTRGFMYAGARNLVVTMWIASDVGARDAMVPFYKHLKKGRSHAEAMRLAKREFIKRSIVHAAPYYWAPYIVIGQ